MNPNSNAPVQPDIQAPEEDAERSLRRIARQFAESLGDHIESRLDSQLFGIAMRPIVRIAPVEPGAESLVRSLDYATEGAAGTDLPLYAPELAQGQKFALPAGGSLVARTGLKIDLPPGYEAQIRPRSGLARDYGLTVVNSPGTIDSDYKGEIRVLLYRLPGIGAPGSLLHLSHGDRIAQLVVALAPKAVLRYDLDFRDAVLYGEDARGEKGFGSTGVASLPERAEKERNH